MQDPGSWIQDPGPRVEDSESWIQDPGCGILDSGCWIQDPGAWIQEPGSRIPDQKKKKRKKEKKGARSKKTKDKFPKQENNHCSKGRGAPFGGLGAQAPTAPPGCRVGAGGRGGAQPPASCHPNLSQKMYSNSRSTALAAATLNLCIGVVFLRLWALHLLFVFAVCQYKRSCMASDILPDIVLWV